jgi:hypothetical protein
VLFVKVALPRTISQSGKCFIKTGTPSDSEISELLTPEFSVLERTITELSDKKAQIRNKNL